MRPRAEDLGSTDDAEAGFGEQDSRGLLHQELELGFQLVGFGL